MIDFEGFPKSVVRFEHCERNPGFPTPPNAIQKADCRIEQHVRLLGITMWDSGNLGEGSYHHYGDPDRIDLLGLGNPN